jgi:hypothetical protein
MTGMSCANRHSSLRLPSQSGHGGYAASALRAYVSSKALGLTLPTLE